MTQVTQPPMTRVYAKVNQKLSMWEVATADYLEAIQTVREVEQITSPVLALIK